MNDQDRAKRIVASILNLSQLDAGSAAPALRRLWLKRCYLAEKKLWAIINIISELLDAGKLPEDALILEALRGQGYDTGDYAKLKLRTDTCLTWDGVRAECAALKDAYYADRAKLAVQKVHNGKQSELLAVSNELAELATDGNAADVRTLASLAEPRSQEILDAKAAAKPSLTSTGVRIIDERLHGGLYPTLVILGAQPGVGKSALLATIAWHQAKVGRRVLFFSLEDDARWLFDRLLALEADLDQWKFRASGPFHPAEEEGFQDGLGKVHHFGQMVLVCDKPMMSAEEIYTVTLQQHRATPVDLVIVDHIGEIKSAQQRDRYDLEVKDTISTLRKISHALSIPTIVCSHTKRSSFEGHEGDQSSLANSSYLERLARLVLLLQRGDAPGQLVLKIAKNTYGKMGEKIALKLKPGSATIDQQFGELIEEDRDERR